MSSNELYPINMTNLIGVGQQVSIVDQTLMVTQLLKNDSMVPLFYCKTGQHHKC